MRLILTSDLHGALPVIPDCDLFLIAGDLCPIECHDLDFQDYWLRNHFVPWLEQVPARHKIFIAGNHDFVMAQAPEMIADIQWPGTYLQDTGCEWENWHIWGSPWATKLTGWPFTAEEEELEQIWSQIPTETEILLVHGPPHGYGDIVIGNLSGDSLHVGSRALREMLDYLPNLRLVVCGHIHEGAGKYQHHRLTIINASLMSEQYEAIQPLRILELT